MTVLKEHRVYTLTPGRVVHSKDGPVPDILSAGVSALAHGTSGNPIADFNEQYNRLRERRRLVPVSNTPHPVVHSTTPRTPFVQERPPPVAVEDDFGELNEATVDEEESGMQSPTLTRMEEDDVSLDMDTIELESTSEDEYDSDVSEGM
ncbi:hypothetical protein HYPSUDRAFT_217473 [Hypholoma sublateritium FD-334 SS-4]|uniref:Uncharacterized protein n=1 Tax=Hypholoma sublateritium (strain FD-334 SS-4) TaxID=945553 RepID=A0A0D2KZ58_HYPSF|nr:hypothetical protein HYPSUDRAFT_217473 [Hypholoma sublateritium FD-334 SS-4]